MTRITYWDHATARTKKWHRGYATGKVETTEYSRFQIELRKTAAALRERTPYTDGYVQALTDYLAYGHLEDGSIR